MDIINNISAILYELDPVGIGKSIDNPHKDEYSPEAKDIANVMSQCEKEEDLYLASVDIFTKWFGEGLFNEEKLKKATSGIFKLKTS